MPDADLFAPVPLHWWLLVGATFGAGLVTQVARLLSRAKAPGARATLALGVCAGIAAITVVALLSVTLPQPASPAILLAAACVTGWSGPGILGRLGGLIERRLGLTGAPPSPLDEPRERR